MGFLEKIKSAADKASQTAKEAAEKVSETTSRALDRATETMHDVQIAIDEKGSLWRSQYFTVC